MFKKKFQNFYFVWVLGLEIVKCNKKIQKYITKKSQKI